MAKKTADPPGRPRGVTMSNVADMAGVTQATVSRALNNPEKVSTDTLHRIEEAIRVTGYVPNLVAGALASNRSRILAAVVPSITNIVYAAMIRQFIRLVREADYQTILVESGFSIDEEEVLVASLLGRRPDGVLLTGIHHSAECRRRLLAAEVPVVEMWDLTESPIDICVGFSHSGSGEAVARYAHEKGYAVAAAVSAGDERALRRKDAFCRAFARFGHATPTAICHEGEASIRRGREALATLVDQGLEGGVIFCSSDLLAHGVLIEAQARGLVVPGTFAVIGFGDQEYAAHTLPPLTTVRVDRAVLGHKAADALLARLDGRPSSVRSIDIGFEIIERGTT